MNTYDFNIRKADGTEVSMADYKGKVLLIVNTATGCGFTPQYDALQDLYDEVKTQGFEIIARFEPTEDMKNVAKKVREIL